MPKPNGDLQQYSRCMDPGILGTFVEEFTSQLTSLGHTRLTVANYGDAARHFAEWLRRSEMVLVDVDDGAIAQFADIDANVVATVSILSFLPNTCAAHAGLFAS